MNYKIYLVKVTETHNDHEAKILLEIALIPWKCFTTFCAFKNKEVFFMLTITCGI